MVYGQNNYSNGFQPTYAASRPELSQQGMGFLPQQPQLKGRYVSSIDEVRAAQIDFDGSLNIFPDLANQCIYTKQVNMDGTASLRVYRLVKENPPIQNNSNYVTKEEFDSTISQLRELLTQEKTDNTSKEEKSSKPIQQAINF